jgi:hypothetical protein
VHFVGSAFPHLHPFYWVFMIGVAVYIFRLLRAVRNAIARAE